MADTKELSVTRYIDAPPETVWDVMVNRQEEWWCPKPWRAEFDVNERRPGGRNEVRMHGPEGEVHTHNGMYLAFDDGRRFVSTDAVQGDFEPADPFMIGIWEIEPEGSGTRYTATARHWTDDAKQRHEEMGFAEGWGVCADQLQALSEEAAKGSGS
ncbi:MAG TPA: SRPBCC family protein [Sphingomonas sp.]|nr:SRPBCC family protein [Sphingomonas sp.]